MNYRKNQVYLVSKYTESWLLQIEKAVQAGVGIVQLRDKTCSDQQLLEWGQELLQRLPNDVPLIINDRLNVAEELGVGLHIGMDDVSPVFARKRLGKQAIIGLTIHDRVELAEKYKNIIDYVGVGPIFQTQTKLDAKDPLGLMRLHSIVERSPVPVVAIGGITRDSIQSVWSQGVSAVALCSEIMDSTDVEQTVIACQKQIG